MIELRFLAFVAIRNVWIAWCMVSNSSVILSSKYISTFQMQCNWPSMLQQEHFRIFGF